MWICMAAASLCLSMSDPSLALSRLSQVQSVVKISAPSLALLVGCL